MSTPQNNARRKRTKDRRIHWLHKYKCAKGCEICGYNENGYALVFDHINPLEKNHYCVGQGKGGSGMNGLVKRIAHVKKEKNRQYIRELFQEIRKCKILCMNCHTIETIESGQSERGLEIFRLRNNPEVYEEMHERLRTRDGFFMKNGTRQLQQATTTSNASLAGFFD